MSTTHTAAPVETEELGDERVGRYAGLGALLRRPEVGASVAAVLVFVYFSFSTRAFALPAGASTWIFTSSSFAIMAVVVAMLMIGGEFDLSAGAMTGTTGLITGIMMSHWHINVWLSVVTSLAVALCIGFVNGFLVMKTGLPSFIVTLGTFFVLRGVNLAVVKQIIHQVSVTDFDSAAGYAAGNKLFGGYIRIDLGWLPWVDIPATGYLRIYAATWWALAVVVVATWVLLRTRAGNWVFAVGGALTSARQVGVPVFRTKVGLFMTTAFGAWIAGMLNLFKTTTAQSTTGVGQEFVYIICAVVGGCLLTGGYGSAVGAALGALIYGMVGQGIVYAGWDSDWLYAILGVMLLGAVMVNNFVKSRAERV
ncbi:MAG: ABC transporter permease [Nocardioides sp.]